MLGGNKVNPMLPFLADDNRYQYQNNASNQLQLFESVPATCSVNPVHYVSKDNIMSMLQASKQGREVDEASQQQKLQFSLNHNLRDEFDRAAAIPPPNPVSTGLRLSYDDDEHNSSITSASGSMTATPSIIMSIDERIRTELDRQNEEFNRFMRLQEEYLMKGVRDIKERHIASFLSAIEREVNKKLHEKDMEIENMNRRNRELGERIKQVAMEVQNWQYRAKYNESVANVLKTNLQQAISMGADQGKEGFGDSEVDDAASYINLHNNTMSSDRGFKEHMVCKACKLYEVSVLLMPCRHLCLCKNCDGLVSVCPVCRLMVTDCVPVYLS
ncbi:BOI-related E3 ubiquitin-protein ligase 1 [Punica granatum]|uniref:RING-type domain-containing protein n=2 Tax=Punica granatum TaxID=22663 RepID=A0A218WT97_PUNGR|nr:BOI-related E3 ubiquitin-protein ligase 1 [Punica granatum]OWM76074.1 hypothetical protein CDL15_Pgr009720 [Punica granatum]PKI62749.1 hypothetical protein CRG98_016848 [Punica granatum]